MKKNTKHSELFKKNCTRLDLNGILDRVEVKESLKTSEVFKEMSILSQN